MKKFLMDIKYDYTYFVKPKWKYITTTLLTIGVIDFMFYVLSNSQAISTDMDHKIIYSFCVFINILFIYTNFKEYVNKGYSRIKKDLMKTYLDEVILKDEQLSKLYFDTVDYQRSMLVSILFNNAIKDDLKSK